MKRTLFLLFFLTPLFGFSQGGGIQFVFQAGLSTHQNIKFDPVWGVASVQLALHLNDFLFLAPECSLWAPDIKLKPFQWAPGVTANYSFGDIFLGGGICRMVYSVKEKDTSLNKWQIKAQMGYLGNSIAVTLFSLMEPDLLFTDMKVGILIGFVL